MVFSSATFLIIFLPLTMVLYYLVGVLITKSTAVKNLILLVASLIFYAWGEPIYIILMLISICFNFVIGKDIDQSKRMNNRRKAKMLFVSAIVFNLAVLGFFKYFNFLLENIANVTGAGIKPLNLALPVGISFYTFQIMSYIIDLYKGNIRAQRRLLNFALYVSLFPQLIAGPIVKYKDIADQLMYRKENWLTYSKGLNRFVFGLSKKLILANTLGSVYAAVQEAGCDNMSVLTAWIGIICYTLQIYFDFSGYSDMAIGLGGIFGFSFCENFNYPYIATSVTDFWRRWHMSLSSWFRDYVYIPLGGNRCAVPRVILNLLIVWLLTGFWHGASWNFILWGVYYGILLILEKYVLAGLIKKVPVILKWLVTMICVMVGWVLFSAPTLEVAIAYIAAMFGYAVSFVDSYGVFILFTNFALLVIAGLCATPLYMSLSGMLGGKKFSKVMLAVTPLLFLLCIIFMISETYNPFLYFRF
ncbi:MAG: MBOAT family protein [Clostridiales bacterium]|nr:MBOAT family protein [Clostridiales bacterium]